MATQLNLRWSGIKSSGRHLCKGTLPRGAQLWTRRLRRRAVHRRHHSQAHTPL